MARIRTIKPEFFSHWSLYEAERDTGLPLRVAFAGLWTQADREGRFRWVPQQLKLGCLPYDDVDFSRVLHALTTRGFIVHYRVNDTDFGAIPGFTRHQVINNRESPSTLPEPNEINTLTREPRVDDACTTPLKHAQGERKGKEGKGREGKGTVSVSSAIARNARVSDESVDEHFESFWNAYDKKRGRSDCEKVWSKINPDDALANRIVRAARTYALATPDKAYRKDPVRWLSHRCWEDEVVERSTEPAKTYAQLQQEAIGRSLGLIPKETKPIEKPINGEVIYDVSATNAKTTIANRVDRANLPALDLDLRP